MKTKPTKDIGTEADNKAILAKLEKRPKPTQTHTHGPWTCAERGYLDGSKPSTWLINACDGQVTVCSSVAKEANARLIAAAPDLLEALKAFAGGFTSPMEAEQVRRRAKAAIAKAEGKE